MTEKRERLLTARDVAEMLQVSPAWVQAHAAGKYKPILPSFKLGKSIRFRESEILEFIDMCRRCMSYGIPLDPERLHIVEGHKK